MNEGKYVFSLPVAAVYRIGPKLELLIASQTNIKPSSEAVPINKGTYNVK